MPGPSKFILVAALAMTLTACMQPGLVRVPTYPPVALDRMERRASLGQADLASGRSGILSRRMEAIATGNGAWATDEAYVILRPTVDAPAVWVRNAGSVLASIGVERHRMRQAPAVGVGARVDVYVYRFATRGRHSCEPLVASLDEGTTWADAAFGKLGCANEANLRAMVSNPRDLQGRAARPLNEGARAAWPVDRYLAPPASPPP